MSTVTEAVPFSVLPTIENHRQRILKIRGVLRFNGTSLELEHQTTNIQPALENRKLPAAE